MSSLVADDFESQLPNLNDYHQYGISSSMQGSDGTVSDAVAQDPLPNSVGIEPEQDSIRSRVEETQSVNLEIDTQAPENTNFVVAQQTDRVVVPPHSIAARTSFISAPEPYEADDITSGFTFGKAPKAKIGQFSRRPQKHTSPPLQCDESGVAPVVVTEQPPQPLEDTSTAPTHDFNQRGTDRRPSSPGPPRKEPIFVQPLNQPALDNELDKADPLARLPTRGGAVNNHILERPGGPIESTHVPKQQALRIFNKGMHKTVRTPVRLAVQARLFDSGEKPGTSQAARLRSVPRRPPRDLPEMFSGGLLRTQRTVTQPFPEVQQAEPKHLTNSPAPPLKLQKPVHRHNEDALPTFPDQVHARDGNSARSSEYLVHGKVQPRSENGNPVAKLIKSTMHREITQADSDHHISRHSTLQQFSLPSQTIPQLPPCSPSQVTTNPLDLPSTPRPQSRSNISASRVKVGDHIGEPNGENGITTLPDHGIEGQRGEHTLIIQPQTSPFKKIGLPSQEDLPSCHSVSIITESNPKRHTVTPEIPQVLRSHLANRVEKSARSKDRNMNNKTASPQRINSPKHWTVPDSKSCLKYLKACEEMLKSHDSNIEMMKTQEAEIKRFRDSQVQMLEKVKNLEEDKSTLIQKVEKYIQFGKTYKEHMNKVVDSQNALKFEAGRIREMSTKAIEAYKGSALAAEKMKASEDKILKSLQEMKRMKLEINKLSAEEHTSLALARQAATTLQERIQELERRLEELNRKEKEASEQLEAVSIENRDARTQLTLTYQANNSLQADIDKQLKFLQLEQNRADRLERELSDKLGTHKDLIAILNKIPENLHNELIKDGGIVSSCLATEQRMSKKFEDVTKSVNELRKDRETVSPALVKLLEDLCKNIPQIQDNNDNFEQQHQQFVALFNDVKISLSQFAVDSEAQKGLNAQIIELQQANLAIIANKNAAELEVKSLSNELQATRNDAANYKSQLDVKARELQVSQALPKEDPKLCAKIEELEALITSLHSKLQSATQQVTSIQEENKNLQETIKVSHNKMHRLENEKKELQTTFKAEKKKTAELVEQEKIEQEKYNENTLQNLRQQVRERMEERNTALKDLEAVQAKLEEATKTPDPAFMEQIVKLSASANHLFGISSSRTTAELNTLRSLEAAVETGNKKFEQTQTEVKTIKEVQEGLTRSLQEFETRDAALSKHFFELQSEAIHRKTAPKSIDILDKSHVTSGLGEHGRVLSTSSTIIQSRTISTPKAAADRRGEIHGSLMHNERIGDIQDTISTRQKATRHKATRAHPMGNRGPNRVAGRVIPDSQSQTEAFSDDQQVGNVEASSTTPTVTRQTLSDSQASESTPALRPFASMDLHMDGSGTSDMTRFSDLGFDDVALELMESKHVIAKAEALSHNKHGNAVGLPAQKTGDRRPLSERNATTSSNGSSVFDFLEHPTLPSPKIIRMQRLSTVKEPLHRQPSKSLKSAMKPITGTTESKGSTSAQPSKPTTQMHPVHAKSFKSNERSGQGAFNLHPGPKRNASAYKRVASGAPASATSNAALANNFTMSNNSMKQTQTSPVPNAARRNSSFTGFSGSKKRPADTQATSSISKAPRLSNPPQINAEIKHRLSIQTAGLGFGKRR